MFAVFDGKVGYGHSLQGALAQVFTGLPSAGQGMPSGTGAGASALVRKYWQQAEQDYASAQAALRGGNLGGYAQAIAQMKQALDNAQQAAGKGSGSASGSSPSPAPTPHPRRRRQPVTVPVAGRRQVRPGRVRRRELAASRAAGGVPGPRRKAYARWCGTSIRKAGECSYLRARAGCPGKERDWSWRLEC